MEISIVMKQADVVPDGITAIKQSFGLRIFIPDFRKLRYKAAASTAKSYGLPVSRVTLLK